MRAGEIGRPIPVEQSVHWKPVYDAHYVVASLQRNDGGRRKIFIRQESLAAADALARGVRTPRVYGLLLGQFYRCPVSGTQYLVVESLAQQDKQAADGDQLDVGIKRAIAHAQDSNAHILGWYCSVHGVDRLPSREVTSIHQTYFRQPWEAVLLLADGATTADGAFFLYDSMNTRWFHAPFYELPDHRPDANQPKTTCIEWPQYMNADNVVLARRQPVEPSRLAAVAPPPIARIDPVAVKPVVDAPLADMSVGGKPIGDRPADSDAARVPPQVPDRPARRTPDVKREAGTSARRVISALKRFDSRVEKLPTIDDEDQRFGDGDTGRRVTDAEDTIQGDTADRYIELARSEGFFIAAKFDTIDDSGQRERLWVLNDPFSGMLLTVVSTDAAVTDASLHYNLHTDDAGLLRTAFPEHRDLDSHTLYVRETCVDWLRARCRRLRSSNALEREWRVTPMIPFLTSGEWRSAIVQGSGPMGIQALSSARISELPEGVRSQFHLDTPPPSQQPSPPPPPSASPSSG